MNLGPLVETHTNGDKRAYSNRVKIRGGHLKYALSLREKGLPILEFGVFKGVTAKLIHDNTEEELHLFDSFLGLPEDWRGENGRLKKTKGSFNTKGIVPKFAVESPRVTIYKGWFKDTLPTLNIERAGLIHIDCDIYSSTIDILYGIKHIILRGTILVFDEFHRSWSTVGNEKRAFLEWVKEFNVNYTPVSHSKLEQVAFKIHSA